MPTYEVEIVERDTIVRRALVMIEAANEEEANDLAEDIEVADWEVVGDDTDRWVENVELFEG